MASAQEDPCSYASASKCATKHLNLSYHVDFERRVLKGKAALTVEVLEDHLPSVTLDTRDLTIFSVTANGQVAKFTMGPKHSFMGTPLEITLPFDLSRGQHVIVEVNYETASTASALQSMIPCQDTPSVKHSYYAQVAMPSYLIAIVVGALESREIGPRSRVWSEKEFVDKAAFEFSETENMLKAAEELVGPYVWGQYDILETGPYPMLNEGHTVYLERMIGRVLESEQFRQFKAIGGWKDLQESVNTFGANNPLTNLLPSLLGVDPDDAFSSVFMGFVKSYIQMFAYSSVTTEEWKAYLFTYFKDKVDVLNKVDWKAWVHTPGMPPVRPQYDTTMADACIALCSKWTKAGESELGAFTEADLKTLSSHQVIEFLSLVLLEEPLPLSHVKRMQEVYDFNSSTNAEIRARWLRLCVRSKWEEAVPRALQMATEQGRMKFTRPLFRCTTLRKYREEAVSTFKANRTAMHPVMVALLSKDLKVDTTS
ncbi:hypothetical protein CRUP_008568 [Coryphaenoides rupestris]|nr:hypothetical protein CRUP_008568 [Coryphaenoides rupestris]